MVENIAPETMADVLQTSTCEVEIRFQRRFDLEFILLIFFSIHSDDLAYRYTLQRFNCYFAAWSVILVTI
jgi:hypothetical protein